MSFKPDWRTVSVTALPPGIWVSFDPLPQYGGESWSWPAVAMLHQVCDRHPDYPGDDYVERIVLGVLNMGRYEIEPVGADVEGMAGIPTDVTRSTP